MSRSSYETQNHHERIFSTTERENVGEFTAKSSKAGQKLMWFVAKKELQFTMVTSEGFGRHPIVIPISHTKSNKSIA